MMQEITKMSCNPVFIFKLQSSFRYNLNSIWQPVKVHTKAELKKINRLMCKLHTHKTSFEHYTSLPLCIRTYQWLWPGIGVGRGKWCQGRTEVQKNKNRKGPGVSEEIIYNSEEIFSAFGGRETLLKGVVEIIGRLEDRYKQAHSNSLYLNPNLSTSSSKTKN